MKQIREYQTKREKKIAKLLRTKAMVNLRGKFNHYFDFLIHCTKEDVAL
jgi:hypothetical protein